MSHIAGDEYGPRYFDWQREGALTSARTMLPIILELVGPASIVDVGCGTGAWLRAAIDLGVTDVLGVDGGAGDLVIPAAQFRRVDLESPLSLNRRFDLAICMEVAEHLPASRAPTLIGDLCAASDVVLFSAAIPGQGDPTTNEHQNERWQSYWAGLFRDQGYQTVDTVRPRIWNENGIAFWYRQNAFFAVAPEARVALEGTTAIRDVVHPDLWQQANATLWATRASPRALLSQLPRALKDAVVRRTTAGAAR